MTGIKTAEPKNTRGWIPAMKMIAIVIMMIVRMSWTICSETNRLIVWTSEVQRWMMSPVLFFSCQA